ncbi:MAG TPA: hypothetical protein VIL91_11595 [Gaiellaceae bacterium]
MRNRRKQAVLWLTLLVVAGCGSSAAQKGYVVQGAGFTFVAPAEWGVSRKGREVQVAQGTLLISVTRFPLFRRFKPALWDKVVPELDRAATAVARQQQGTVSDPRTVTVAGQKARRYDVAYAVEGKQLVERIAFVLRGKTEYLLLCRYERGGRTEACDRLLTSFRLAAA